MRYFTFVRFILLAAAVSLLLFHPAIIRAQEDQAASTTEDGDTEPARETPGFFPPSELRTSAPGETPAPSPSAAPAPVAGEARENNDDRKFGVGLFSTLPFHLSVSVSGGYDDNVLNTPNGGSASLFANPSAEINYKFADPRTTVVLKLNTGVTYYFDRSDFPTQPPPPFGTPTPPPKTQDYDIDVSVGLSASHKASARLTINGSVNLSYKTQPDFSANVGTNRRTGNYLYNSDRFNATFQWLPRFATNTSYNLGVVRYDDETFGASLNRSEHTLGNEFRFQLTPMTTLVAEGRVLFVAYENGTLDSMTEILLGGIEHKFNPRLAIGLRGGNQFRSFDNGGDTSEPYFETVLNYAAGKRTLVNWFTRYSLEEPAFAGSQTVTTFRTGLVTKYVVAPRINSSIGFYYVRDDYPAGPRPPRILPPPFPRPEGAPAITEDAIDVTLGLQYEISRSLGVYVSYGHTEVISDIAQREYSRNRYFGGVNFSF